MKHERGTQSKDPSGYISASAKPPSNRIATPARLAFRAARFEAFATTSFTGRCSARATSTVTSTGWPSEDLIDFSGLQIFHAAVVHPDLNGDGALDIVAVHWLQPHSIFLNDGKGRFAGARHFGDGRDQAWSVAVADFDSDGDVDLVIGNSNIGYWREDVNGDGRPDRGGNLKGAAPSRIYWNDGHGAVTGGPAVGIEKC